MNIKTSIYMCCITVFMATLAYSDAAVAAKKSLPRGGSAESIIEVAQSSTSDSADDELLILQLKLGSILLTEDMLGLSVSAGLLLPLGELSKAIGLSISTDSSTGRAGGWFIRENRLFSLNVGSREVVVEGKVETFDAGLVKIAEDDIFVDARLLAKWFPIDIDFDIANMSVKLTSREPLPMEEMLAREDRRKKIKKRSARELNPRHDIPYELFRVPVLDVSMDHTFSSDQDDNTSNNTRISALAAGDLGGHSAQLYLSGDDAQRISQARLELGRKDPDGQLLGPLQATDYSFGDISTSQVPLVSGVVNGRGVKVTNHPVESPDEFDRMTLEGDLLTGWDVELYRNEVLIEFKSSQSDGRYTFTDVPLLFGVNVLKLIFYGPQGQVREEIKQIRIGPGQIKPGVTLYKASVSQQDRQLLLGDEYGVTTTDQTGKLRANVNLQHGISKNFSVGTHFTTVPSINGSHQNYLGVNLRGFYGSVTGRLDTVRDLSKGWASKASIQTSISDISVLLDHARYYDYYSEQISNQSDPLLHQTNLRLDGIARVPLIPHVPYSLTLSRDYHESGDALLTLNNRLSMAVGPAALTNNLSWVLNHTPTTEDSNISGSAALGGSINDIRVRGAVIYKLDPDTIISSGTISGDWQFTDDYRAKLAIDKNFDSTRLTTYSAGLTTQFEWFALGGNIDYSHRGDLSARMSVNFSLGQDPHDKSVFMRGKHSAGKGGVASRVFLDNNANGIFDSDDEPIENVAIKFDNSVSERTTNEQGFVTATGISPFRPVNVTIDKKSLEDPFWTPATDGVSIVPRPGVIGVVDFPVLTSGEIDGTVYRKKGQWASEVSDVVLQLVDEKGKVVRETSSSYDGFYLFDFVRPGKYAVRVEPEQMKRLNISQPASKPVEITGKGSVASDVDFILASERRTQNFRVLLTAFGSLDGVKKAWAALQKEMGRTLRKLHPIIDKGTSPDGKQTLYYLYTGSFASRGSAETLCKQVRALKGQAWCNPIRVEVEAANLPNRLQDGKVASSISGTMLQREPVPNRQATPPPAPPAIPIKKVTVKEISEIPAPTLRLEY